MEEEVEWPSTRIPHGGMYHLPKPNFSKETQDLIKLLMDEAHLTMMQRKKINYHLRNGDPLPPPEMRPPESDDSKMQAYNIMMKVRNIRKRSLESIKASGAFNQEKYAPPRRGGEPSHLAKLRLQEFMSGIKEYPEVELMKLKNKYKHKKVDDGEWIDPVNEILKEIYERADWLAEMEDLGEGKRHRDVIQAQIAERLHDIKRIQQQKRELLDTQKLQSAVKKDVTSAKIFNY